VGRLVVSEFITLDGVVEAPGGEFHPDGKTAWVVPYFTEETGAFKLNELHETDALLLGRATYEQFAKAWPTAADEQGFADRMNSLPKYVASTSLDEPLEWNSTLIKGDISEVVAELIQNRLIARPQARLLLGAQAHARRKQQGGHHGNGTGRHRELGRLQRGGTGCVASRGGFF